MNFAIGIFERNYIIDGVNDGTRNDGRGLLDYRPIFLELGVFSSVNGSARVQVGGTEVLVSVKADISSTEFEEGSNILQFFVDVSATASPSFSGKKGSEFGEEFSSALQAAYSDPSVLPDFHRLILSKTHFWMLYIDVIVIQLDGNPMDAISLAVKAALTDTRICNVVVRPTDEDKVLIDLPDEVSLWKMDTSKTPLVICVDKIGEHSVIDPDLPEEQCATSSIFVGVKPFKRRDEISETRNSSSLITCIRKASSGTLELNSIEEMVATAVLAANALDEALTLTIQQVLPE